MPVGRTLLRVDKPETVSEVDVTPEEAVSVVKVPAAAVVPPIAAGEAR
jgi:hypothetical protein